MYNFELLIKFERTFEEVSGSFRDFKFDNTNDTLLTIRILIF